MNIIQRLAFLLSVATACICSASASQMEDEICIYRFSIRNADFGIYVASHVWLSQPSTSVWNGTPPSIAAAIEAIKQHFQKKGRPIEMAFRLESISLRAPTVVFGDGEQTERLFYLFTLLPREANSHDGGADSANYVAVLNTGEVIEARLRNCAEPKTSGRK